jgi:hypothetical protein
MAIDLGGRTRLLVSLPRNEVALARAAADGGADGIKLHVNVEHRASGTVFGPVDAEREAIEEIIALGLPVGVVAGGEGAVQRSEVRALVALGVDFIDAYLHHAPPWYCTEAPADGAMVALSHDDPIERAGALRSLGITAVEASLAAPEQYGSPLHLGRLTDIVRLREISGLPVVVPTQHAIVPEDVPALVEAGPAALLIGAVVTGTDTEGVGRATTGFRAAIDACS